MEKKQTSLQRMFEVLKAIEHEDLNNSQYTTLDVAEGDYVNTASFFGSSESKVLDDNCMYIFIWVDGYKHETEDFPTPDFTLTRDDILIDGAIDGDDSPIILGYQFENK